MIQAASIFYIFTCPTGQEYAAQTLSYGLRNARHQSIMVPKNLIVELNIFGNVFIVVCQQLSEEA